MATKDDNETVLLSKIAAQIPVKAAELRNIWLDMLKFAKAMPVEAVPPKDEIASKVVYFKAPESEPMLEDLRKDLDAIKKHLEENKGVADEKLANMIRRFSKGPRTVGQRRPENSAKACRDMLFFGAKELRDAWSYARKRIVDNHVYATAMVKAWLVTELEPNFEGILRYLSEIPVLYLEAERLAQLIHVPPEKPSACSCCIL